MTMGQGKNSNIPLHFSSVQSLSRVRLFAIPWTAARQASLSITNSQSLLKPMSIKSVMPSNRLILWCPVLSLPSIFPSIMVFFSDSVLQRSAFFIVQLTSLHDYWKTKVLTRQTFVGKVMSLLLNMLSRLVLALLPRNKCLLISWLQSPCAVILEPPKNKVCHCFHCFSICVP